MTFKKVYVVVNREALFAETSIEHIMGIFSTIIKAKEAKAELIMNHGYSFEELWVEEVIMDELRKY